MLENDTLANILHIDLTKKKFWTESRKELFDKYIGGAGVAIQLLHEECPENCDPLGEQNPIIFAVGPLTGLYPLASKTIAMFKSPHTGNLGESHCGGRSAMAIRMAGYGAIIIKGKCDIPIYISIHGSNVQFRNATSLWGMSSTFTVGRIIRESETESGLRTIMRIGEAGEKMVTYANVMSETYRHFGRMGLGAVFGSKNLKAVVIAGKRTFPVRDIKEYKKLYNEIYKTAVESPLMKKYHDIGTAVNVMGLNALGALPTRNLTSPRFEEASNISGENFAKNYLGRRLACAHCPIACIHIAALREPYEDEPYFYKTSMISYDYEPIYAIGSMIGLSDPEKFLKLMDKIETLGLDVMSTGVALAWATEALKKDIISNEQTLNVKLQWGDQMAYLKAIELIIEQPNEFYKDLAKGVSYVSSKYGGKEFDLTFGKNEMSGYHTGPASYMGFAIGARHSHLDNAGYSLDQKILLKEEIPPEKVVENLIKEEEWRQILSSLTICFFAREIYKPEIVTKALNLSGYEVKIDDLEHIGREIHRNKYKFKFREGFTFENFHLAKRIFEISSPVNFLNEEYIRKGINYFKKFLNSEES